MGCTYPFGVTSYCSTELQIKSFLQAHLDPFPFSWSYTGGNVHQSDLIDVSFNIVEVEHKRRHIPSASSALVIGGILGLVQAVFLISAAKPLLNFMGVTSVSVS